MEEWRNIVGYEGSYQISDNGNVRSVSRIVQFRNGRKRQYNGQIVKQYIKTNGYCCVKLYKGRQYQHMHVHRLVAEAFVPNTESKATVNHKDENKKNNNASNLEWATYSENLDYNNGRAKRAKTMISKYGKRLGYFTTKSVLQFSKTGEFIKQWDSASSAKMALGIRGNSVITDCAMGHRKTASGFIWKYA